MQYSLCALANYGTVTAGGKYVLNKHNTSFETFYCLVIKEKLLCLIWINKPV